MKVLASAKDSRKSFELRVSDDGLKLFLSLSPTQGTTGFTEEEITEVARTVAYEALIDEAVIRDVVSHLNRGQPCLERRIAKGRAPEPGLDGRVVWLVKKLGTEGQVQTDARGFADFVHMHLFDNITQDQKLVRIYRPKPGINGVDVTGKVLAAPIGKSIAVRIDATVRVEHQEDEGFDLLVAQTSGYAYQQGDTVGVKETLVIPGDLDYHFGSIDFVGSVSVTGDVHKGFSIRAEKTIEVRGNIQGESILWARNGVKVGGSHFGGQNTDVSTLGWYHVRAARGVNVDSEGPILVDREAFDCDFTTRDILYAPNASIVGGTIRCVRGVEVANLGNHSGKTTTVQLCVGPEASADYTHLEREILRHEEAINLLKLHLGPFASLGVKIDRLNEPQRSRVNTLYVKLQAVERSLASLALKKKQLLETTVDESAVVTVLGTLYSGVVIKRREGVFVCTDPITGPVSVKFNLQSGALEVSTVERLNAPSIEIAKPKRK